MSRYAIELTLIRDMLGTNPADPNVHDQHVIQKQKKLIEKEGGKLNREINKYQDAMDISEERTQEEKKKIIARMEERFGISLTDEERKSWLEGKLEDLKETIKSIEDSGQGTTIFFWDDEKKLPVIGDHMIYGFMKASVEAIGRTMEKGRGEVFKSISYTQSLINQHVRCEEQFLAFDNDIKRLPSGRPAYLQRSLRAETAQGPRITLVKSEVIPKGSKLNFVMKVMDNSPLTEEAIKRMFGYGDFVGLGQWRNAGYGMFTFTMKKL